MPCDSHGRSHKLARPQRFELPTPRFVVCTRWSRRKAPKLPFGASGRTALTKGLPVPQPP